MHLWLAHSAGVIRCLLAVSCWGICFAAGPADLVAAEFVTAELQFKSGQYVECIETAQSEIESGDFSESWRVLKIEAELTLGRYDDALATLKAALEKYPYSVRLRWIGRDVYRFHGDEEAAEKAIQEIGELVERSSWRYRDAINRVTLGRYFLDAGADAKEVLKGIYGPVKSDFPNLPQAFIASGELALAKNDYGLAASALERAAELDPKNPQVQFLLARAYRPSDSDQATTAVEKAIELNPNHAPSLLLLVDQHIDAERYEEAEKLLARVLKVNPHHPQGWAYRAVIAHLDNDAEEEKSARERALSKWARNPEVDFLIGKKLSQKYRFAEGAVYQRKSLELDATYLPAKMQLCQDLLRLGHEEEGWKLANEVFDNDNYNVVAHNLATLRDRLKKFAVLESDGFVVRMDAREAKIYGRRVLDVLRRAKQHLCSKYDVELEEPIYVDIYPHQQDFAIRTFGLPGGAGFLGVCFGRVITMNSPASQGATPSNWESVLWHEFCHVVTLSKTKNKMPRWLSEGISVYEERQYNPAWGQSMNFEYREMISGDQLTPVSELSGAFLNAESPLHLQFAYYESSLVVEYLVEKYGLETLQRILVDLGVGMPINESLQRYTGSLAALDKEFASYAREKAATFAPDVNIDEPELPRNASVEVLADWVKENPDSYRGLQRYAAKLLSEEKWEAAKEPLNRLLGLWPEYDGRDGPLWMLARVHRELDETPEERATLEKIAQRDDSVVDVYLRLAELCAAEEDWEAVIENAELALAVNPLIKAPHRHLADAASARDDHTRAVEGLLSLAEMEPFDPAGIHYQTARHLFAAGESRQAKRHVLMALEEAPRYRDAHRLLLEIIAAGKKPELESAP